MKHISLSILFLALTFFTFPLATTAQKTWEGPLPPTRQSAYHDIYLPPEITCHSTPGGENIRIYDSNGTEVPYIKSSESHVDQSVQLKWYKQTGGNYHRHWYTRAIFENARKDAIEEIVLKVRNADVAQRFWLSGSDDMNHWYIIKENFHYNSNYDPASTYNLLTLNFPPVDYRYYKVELKHTWREPINIMGAGYYDVKSKAGHYQEIKGLSVTQSDDSLGKKSYVEIDLGENHYLDRLHLVVDGPEMYLRNATLESVSGGTLHESFTLSSQEVSQLVFEDLRSRKLRLTIDNKDDLPIRIAGVRAYQLKMSLTARLEKGANYQMVLSEENQMAPQYDLIHFADKLPRNRPKIWADSIAYIPPPAAKAPEATEVKMEPYQPEKGTGAVTSGNEPLEQKEEEVVPLLKNKAFLWAGIGVILVAMVWFSIVLLREKPPV